MSVIIPALMPKKFSDIKEAADLLVYYVDTIQLDIMDGTFVPNRSWPFPLPDASFDALQNEDIGMPSWEEMNYELDLMIRHPDDNFEQWLKLGPSRVVVHIESLKDPQKFFESIQGTRLFIEIGVSFDNSTGVDSVLPYLSLVDFVQIMGIARIGFQGEPFDDRALYNIEQIKKAAPNMIISVDGAVNTETIQRLKNAGVSRFVAGSAIFHDEMVENNIRELQALVQ